MSSFRRSDPGGHNIGAPQISLEVAVPRDLTTCLAPEPAPWPSPGRSGDSRPSCAAATPAVSSAHPARITCTAAHPAPTARRTVHPVVGSTARTARPSSSRSQDPPTPPTFFAGASSSPKTSRREHPLPRAGGLNHPLPPPGSTIGARCLNLVLIAWWRFSLHD